MNKINATHGLMLTGLALALAACGGGGGGSDEKATAASPTASSSAYAKQCAVDNPYARDAQGQLLQGLSSGSREQEYRYVHALMKEIYLWADEMPEVDSSNPVFHQGTYGQAMSTYFASLLTPGQTPSGKPKDRFSEVVSTAAWQASGEAGRSVGPGFEPATLSDATPRDVRVALVEPGSEAAKAGVSRGDRLQRVTLADGRSIDVLNTTDQQEIALYNQLFSTQGVGQEATWVVQKPSGEQAQYRLRVTEYAGSTVPVSKVVTAADGAKVGYLFVKTFYLPTEGSLQKAFAQFKQQGISDLVVDLRYNQGGYLTQGAQMAYMTTDAALTQGKIFERMQYNSRRDATIPAAGKEIPFISKTSGTAGTGTAAGESLPSLGLKRVYVLTGAQSCSTSEAYINGLRGIDVQVIQIGATTCGKPYGSEVRDNCGVSFKPIEFTGVNQKGEGDYQDGIAPTCEVGEDWVNPLGDSKEALLAAALQHRATGRCPADTAATKARKSLNEESTPRLLRPLGPTTKLLAR